MTQSQTQQLSEIFDNLKNQPNIEISIDPHMAFILVEVLQLAFRHPSLQNESSANDIKEFSQQLIDILGEIDPKSKSYLERGINEADNLKE